MCDKKEKSDISFMFLRGDIKMFDDVLIQNLVKHTYCAA